jgi:hypothetical protein
LIRLFDFSWSSDIVLPDLPIIAPDAADETRILIATCKIVLGFVAELSSSSFDASLLAKLNVVAASVSLLPVCDMLASEPFRWVSYNSVQVTQMSV